MFLNATKVSLTFLAAALFLVPTVVAGQPFLPDSGSPACDWYVTSNVFEGFDPAPTSCYGSFSGNDELFQTEIRNTLNRDFGGDWANLGKLEAEATEFFSPFGPGSTFGGSGTIYLSPPFTGVFALILKSANRFSIYLFSGTGLQSIDYVTAGTADGGGDGAQDLSHVSFWSPNGTTVPEPSSLLLLGSGLLGLGFVGYRRRRK